jgi:hypothetical protein
MTAATADYETGRQDGLREAVEIVRGLAEAVERRLARPSPRRTRNARQVRHKALSVAATRITTALRKTERRRQSRSAPISDKLQELGL